MARPPSARPSTRWRVGRDVRFARPIPRRRGRRGRPRWADPAKAALGKARDNARAVTRASGSQSCSTSALRGIHLTGPIQVEMTDAAALTRAGPVKWIAPSSLTGCPISLTKRSVEACHQTSVSGPSRSSVSIAAGDGGPSLTRGRQWAGRVGREQAASSSLTWVSLSKWSSKWVVVVSDGSVRHALTGHAGRRSGAAE